MAWYRDSRPEIWSRLDQVWDVIVIGGGITGAGILREASRLGLKTLLVEAGDYAQGTSSKSSKLVHGGLRYLKNGQIKTTLESVTERDFLLRQGKGLVNRLGFLFVNLKGDRMPAWLFGLGLSAYDMMARQWTHRSYDALDICEMCPPLSTPLLRGGYRYFDAQTDDARLVLRLLQEGVQYGGTALNYARVTSLLRDQHHQVRGVVLRDEAALDKPEIEIQARAVINATGAWADFLRTGETLRPRLRPVRGSHLVLPASRLPLTRAISLMHPRNARPVFILPWEGVILVGTTDVDHTDLQNEPRISAQELDFLLEAVQHVFPESRIETGDIQATFSGLRPVVSTGKSDPSKESREHAVWFENGLLTVTGGKLTTFRLMARQALRELRRVFPDLPVLDRAQPVLMPPPDLDDGAAASSLAPAAALRLAGRYGADAPDLLRTAHSQELVSLGITMTLWAELRWAARAEAVVHLDDLLLRRVRLGLLLPQGGKDCLADIRCVVQSELGWEDAMWEYEARRYLDIWQKCYNLPE